MNENAGPRRVTTGPNRETLRDYSDRMRTAEANRRLLEQVEADRRAHNEANPDNGNSTKRRGV